MTKFLKRKSLQVSAAVVAGAMLSSDPAFAAAAGGNNNFSSIASNVTSSIASVPGLLTGLAYMFGILLGVLGILKIKDHVENPSQTPIKDGAIRLAAGGALFALPIVYESMTNTIGANGAGADAATLSKVGFNIK
jgi:hypothetical protein